MMVNGLRAKLILAYAGVIALFTGIFAWYLLYQQESISAAALETRARGMSGVLAKLVAPAVEFDDHAAADNAVVALRGHADLRYVAILKPGGEVFLHHGTAGAGESEYLENTRVERVVRPNGAGGLMHVLVPLVSKGNALGTLVAGFSRKSIDDASRINKVAVLVGAALVLLIGIAVAWLISGSIARPILEVAQRLTQLSQDMVGAARNQETQGTQQATGIEQTRQALETVLASAQQIAERSSAVLGNAERTVNGNRDVAHRIKELNDHAEKVAEILAAIMQVADRTDLLALNAALEGTKAGEAGRGFTLVAAEMRRLAESVMESVASIRRLMNDMRAASQSAVQAGQEGIARSEETTRSARDIALVTQQQRKATEQVGHSMDDMAATVSSAMTSTRRTAANAAELVDAALRLDRLVGRGKLRAPIRAPSASESLPDGTAR